MLIMELLRRLSLCLRKLFSHGPCFPFQWIPIELECTYIQGSVHLQVVYGLSTSFTVEHVVVPGQGADDIPVQSCKCLGQFYTHAWTSQTIHFYLVKFFLVLASSVLFFEIILWKTTRNRKRKKNRKIFMYVRRQLIIIQSGCLKLPKDFQWMTPGCI